MKGKIKKRHVSRKEMVRRRCMLSSLHIIVISMVALCSFTWAWFTEVIDGKFIIKTATYDAEISVSGNGSPGFVTITDGDNLLLEKGKPYDIRIKARGTAQQGYCIVTAGDAVYYTVPLVPEAEMVFSIVSGGDIDSLEVGPSWGMYGDEVSEDKVLEHRDVVSDGDAE